MKKILSLVIAILVFSSMLCLNTLAVSAEPVDVYVTISDKGTLKVSAEKISVTDKDSDGSITIDEALYAAHEKYYTGGAAAGYASAPTAYGISIIKLWGDTSGSFGYYLNNASAMSLADTVQNGDYIVAFVYSDTASWSDTYTFFDKNTLDAERGEEITLVLKESGYDDDWNPVVSPLANATVTVNGEDTEYKTDNEGKVTVKFDKGGKYVISARTDETVIVPPVCVVTVPVEEEQKPQIIPEQEEQKPEINDEVPQKNESSPKTSDDISCYISVILIAAATIAITLKKNAFYEK